MATLLQQDAWTGVCCPRVTGVRVLQHDSACWRGHSHAGLTAWFIVISFQVLLPDPKRRDPILCC